MQSSCFWPCERLEPPDATGDDSVREEFVSELMVALEDGMASSSFDSPTGVPGLEETRWDRTKAFWSS